MPKAQSPDPREELRRHPDSDEITAGEADRALTALNREKVLAAVHTAERSGTLSIEETDHRVDS